MRTLRDLGDLDGKRVLVRVDLNVPLDHGVIADDTRIRAAVPTIEELRRRGARLVLVSHLGRPENQEPELSMRPAADRLAELTEADVTLAPAVVGEEVRALAENLNSGDVLVLENVRYEPGETSNDPDLAASLAELADVYVNDAFGPPIAPMPRPKVLPTWWISAPPGCCRSARLRPCRRSSRTPSARSSPCSAAPRSATRSP